MNVASKLGEDVAGRGEVLLSVGAHERIGGDVDADRNPRAAIRAYAAGLPLYLSS